MFEQSSTAFRAVRGLFFGKQPGLHVSQFGFTAQTESGAHLMRSHVVTGSLFIFLVFELDGLLNAGGLILAGVAA